MFIFLCACLWVFSAYCMFLAWDNQDIKRDKKDIVKDDSSVFKNLK